MNQNPKVSVVIPVFNDFIRLDKCLSSLADQTYKGDVEIIVADNNSTQSAQAVSKKYPFAKFITVEKPGSYSARNAALSLCSGNVIAFTDSDCIPDANWIRAGVECLHYENADLVGGNVDVFIEGDNAAPSWAEAFELLLAFPQKENAALNRSVTANLFITAEARVKTGFFDEDTYSGADYDFSKRATTLGFKLVFGEDAIVKHPARPSLKLLRKKAKRVVGGFYALRNANEAMSKQFSFLTLVKDAVPPFQAITTVAKTRKAKGVSFIDGVKAILVAWHNKLYRLIIKLGFLLGFLSQTDR